jgi:hypothetical protein
MKGNEMTDKTKGQSTTPEELFTHCVALAEMTDTSLKANRALKDEIQREHTDVVNGLSRLAQLHTPDMVVRTVEQARAALREFKQEADGTIVGLKGKTDQMMKKAGRQWLVSIVLTCACLAAAVVFLTKLIPGFDEIQSRRTELAQLMADRNSVEEQLKAKREELAQWQGKLLQYNGEQFVRIYYAPQEFCTTDANRTKTCGTYVPLR